MPSSNSSAVHPAAWMPAAICLFVALVGSPSAEGAPSRADRAQAATRQAVKFLTEQVRVWPTNNGCFSCHNNGDGARVLYQAASLDMAVSLEELEQTTAWLANPRGWEDNGGDEQFSDKTLADLQFGFALLAARRAGAVRSGAGLNVVAQRLAESQSAEGHWAIDAPGSVGSPVTYGPVLATVVARRILVAAGPAAFADAIEEAQQWLLQQRPRTMLDAAALLLGLEDMQEDIEGVEPPAKLLPPRRHALQQLKQGQAASGGWGPYRIAAAEPFDTAVVVLALAATDPAGQAEAIRRGRRYLISTQRSDGSWPATTRPAGADSYAQQMSTTAWATQALLLPPAVD